jgi:transposase
MCRSTPRQPYILGAHPRIFHLARCAPHKLHQAIFNRCNACYRGPKEQFARDTCLAHLLRRCREMLLVAGKGEAEFPRTVQTMLQQALQLRDRRQQRQISEQGLAVARGRLEVRMDRSLQRRYRSPQNRRLANHLLRERDALFTFLSCPGLEATNWRAEQAIRPIVVTRKVWGGNRTSRGAHTQGILVSILQTCRQQLRSASSILQKLICAPQPKPVDLTVPTR